jgi:dnd system-associated protein 4
MLRRIYRDPKNEDVYEKLCEVEGAVFSQLKDLFLMSVSIGYKYGQRKKLSKRGKEFHWSVFSKMEQSILNAVALSESDQIRILDDEYVVENEVDDKVTIIEEYANLGIEYIRSEVLDKGGNVIENLVAYLYSQKDQKDDNGFNLGGLLELSEEL